MTPEQRMIERRWERQARAEQQVRREIIFSNKAIVIVALLCLSIPMPTLGEYALSGVLTLAALSVQGLATLWLYPRRF